MRNWRMKQKSPRFPSSKEPYISTTYALHDPIGMQLVLANVLWPLDKCVLWPSVEWIHTWMYVCINTYINEYIHECMYVSIHTLMCVCTYAYIQALLQQLRYNMRASIPLRQKMLRERYINVGMRAYNLEIHHLVAVWSSFQLTVYFFTFPYLLNPTCPASSAV